MTTQLPLPKERLEKIASWRETYGAGHNVMLPAEEAEALARALLAAYEQEPVGEVIELKGGLVMDGMVNLDNRAYREIKGVMKMKRMPLGTKFYTHPAPSIPIVSFYRDGIVAAAKWVDAQREAYDNEHGHHDPDTGTFEFGNDAQLEYSSTLADIADGIRALHPNAASVPSIPAAVPEEKDKFSPDVKSPYDAGRVRGWNDCRAAMLAAAPKGGIE